MRSVGDAKPPAAPPVLPSLLYSDSLSSSSLHKRDDHPVIIAGATSPLPPHSGLRSMLTKTSLDNAISAASPPRTVEARDDPLLASLAKSDLSVARSVAENYCHQYKESVAENAQLRASLQQHEDDSIQVVHFLEEKLKDLQTEAANYKKGMTQLLDDHRSAEEALQEKYGDMIRERDAELARYATVTAKLHDDLHRASRYVQQRHTHATELLQLQEQLSELAASHEKELAALHFQTVDRKLKLIALEKAMRAEFDALVEARATKALEERFQSVLERTRNLESEKLSLTRNLQDLMQLASQLDAERLQVRREAAVQQQAQKELKSHALVRGRLKEQADLKVYQLEERLREVSGRYKRQLAETEARHAARIASLEEELKATRNSLQSHRAELQQMRQLTAKVVGERSELENFFHTALADCQRYRCAMGAVVPTATTATTAALNGNSRGTLPEKVEWGGENSTKSGGVVAASAASLVSGSIGASPQRNSSAPFEDLSWKDKEKVIKSLLFFLNANYYKNTPGTESGPTE
ncbi:hypothetical protein ABB37_05729 [Leptomonas pyrrhocoris]|uniref:Basal body-orientation factor 1 n=1 Tax=Leptomonas pyrrhocoris TaxID=157538 RepID=A0A0N0VET1_LEPPY|nr:hypothetical protein ABB37_05729 [Leptomonas pyrrhocoris]XP_015657691.1 hypothetical protein ABB37_05729 [Leptomonas pyrrhocoris]KPA79251.1 hypothetical protein ABB37_05729 [Leptomonas pyrrhocoris]KPA79252.1 hypothetical protein ABB37_05729 [Leptomonas pyrrhocoris]|eukprot:XP_015657690.1 hypothetical protein ABB37_05729 [Leptomonas pyrrhocoris]